MPLAVAEYLRHLATRCSRMSRDCTDPVVIKELVIISVELVERAETLEAHFSMSASDDPLSNEIVTTGGDNDDAA
jgi:hypothetical protein